jgi:serine/threonine protein kinase
MLFLYFATHRAKKWRGGGHHPPPPQTSLKKDTVYLSRKSFIWKVIPLRQRLALTLTMASVQSKSIVDGKFVLSNVEIGGGTVGRVFAGEDTIGEPIAVKLMEIESMRESDLQRLNGEVVALSRLHSHPNIVSLKYGGILNEPGKSSITSLLPKNGTYNETLFMRRLTLGLLGYINPFALVLERAHCDLMDYIIDRVDGCLSEDVTRTFMHHICSAVSECHKHSIYHMDIKPENLLIGKDLQLKLADFGVATECKGKMMNDRIGTIAYMAPEVFDGRVYNAEKADVWSIGCGK